MNKYIFLNNFLRCFVRSDNKGLLCCSKNHPEWKKPDTWFYLEGIVVDCSDHILKEYLGGEGVSMVNDGLSVGTIPAVHFNTTAATTQSPNPQSEIPWYFDFGSLEDETHNNHELISFLKTIGLKFAIIDLIKWNNHLKGVLTSWIPLYFINEFSKTDEWWKINWEQCHGKSHNPLTLDGAELRTN